MNKRLGALTRGFSVFHRHGMSITIATGVLVIALALGWLCWQGPTWTARDEQPLAPWPLRLAISVVLVVIPLLAWT